MGGDIGAVRLTVAACRHIRLSASNFGSSPGQNGGAAVGTSGDPSTVARVLGDGTTQAWQTTYNAEGRATSRTDPLGRQTTYVYAVNGIDLLEMRQTTGGATDLLVRYTDYTAHLPGGLTDAAGQTTTYTYDAAGQVLTATTPPRAGITEDRTTTNTYDADGRLERVTGPLGTTTTYTYDAFGRVRTVTDADG